MTTHAKDDHNTSYRYVLPPVYHQGSLQALRHPQVTLPHILVFAQALLWIWRRSVAKSTVESRSHKIPEGLVAP